MAEALSVVIMFDTIAADAQACTHQELKGILSLKQVNHCTTLDQVLAGLYAVAVEQERCARPDSIDFSYGQHFNELYDRLKVSFESELAVGLVHVRT